MDIPPTLTPQPLPKRIANALRWRSRRFAERLRRLLGETDLFWSRVVMDEQTAAYVRSLDYKRFDALEISGTKWATFGFATYRNVSFPDYDVCERPLCLEGFDIVIAEQVLEHVLDPLKAAANVREMLRPAGVFLVTTPFLLRIHNDPLDLWRWTETGLKTLLSQAGFDPLQIQTGSWGNIACVEANFRCWTKFNKWFHSLENEPDFPIHVWAFARR